MKILMFFLPAPASASFVRELEGEFFSRGLRRLAHGHRCHAFAAIADAGVTESLRQEVSRRVGVEVSCGGGTGAPYSFDQYAAYLRLVAAMERDVARWDADLGQQVRAQLAPLAYPYTVARPIVFNRDLWRLPGPISHLLAGDNPGKEEQAKEQYLIGNAGKCARACHSSTLGIDFDARVLVVNKTAVHTRYTSHLKKVDLGAAGHAMQRRLGWLAAAMAQALNCPLWITGISELDGLFAPFVEGVRARLKAPAEAERVRVFKHFSRNCFVTELKAELAAHPGNSTEELLATISARHRRRKLGY